MADPILGYGTTLEVDFGAGFVTVARLAEIAEIGGEAADIDITTHDSGAAGFRVFMAGLQDPGEMTFRGYWTGDATQAALMNEMLAGAFARQNYPGRVTLPQGRGVWSFTGYVKSFKLNPRLDGPLEFNGALRYSVAPSFAVTESAGLTTPYFVVTPNAGVGATYVPTRAAAPREYYVTVDTIAVSVTVTPTATAGVIKVNGTVVATGVASGSITLGAAGSATDITITVQETNTVAQVYTLHIIRP
jgi:hypothetical protein